MSERLRRLICVVALTAGLGLSTPARAQALMIPVAPPAAVFLLPLIMVLVPLGMELGKSDEERVRELEARRDWQGVVALADRRLDTHPGDLRWREIRGRAWYRSGRCVQALPDLREVFQARASASHASDDGTFELGLSLGLCEMALQDLDAAQRTMQHLAALAPQRWEPAYNLAVIADRRHDAAAAQAALHALEAIDAARATQLRMQLDAAAQARAGASATAPVAASPPAVAHPRVSLHGTVLSVGRHTLELPGSGWALWSIVPHVVLASTFRSVHRGSEVPLVTVHVIATDLGASLAGALAFTAGVGPTVGHVYWDAEDFCKVGDALLLERRNRSLDRPECLYVRAVLPGTTAPTPRLAPLWTSLAQAGLRPVGMQYEIHYSNYGVGCMVAATWLLPASRLAGDLAAVQWARDMAAQLAPVDPCINPAPAEIPALASPRAAAPATPG